MVLNVKPLEIANIDFIKPSKVVEQQLNSKGLVELKKHIAYLVWLRRVLLVGGGNTSIKLFNDLNEEIFDKLKTGKEDSVILNTLYDCPKSLLWKENLDLYLPYLNKTLSKYSSLSDGEIIYSSSIPTIIEQIKLEMVNPKNNFSFNFLGWISNNKKEKFFGSLRLQTLFRKIYLKKTRSLFLYNLKEKRKQILTNLSYSVFQKEWRKNAKSKRLAKKSKIDDISSWSKNSNSLDVKWLSKRLFRSKFNTPIIYWWRKKNKFHSYWNISKKRKIQKSLKYLRGARRLFNKKNLKRSLLLSSSGLFTICNPFNGRWARSPKSYPFRSRKIKLKVLAVRQYKRRRSLETQSLYLRWLYYMTQKTFWFNRYWNIDVFVSQRWYTEMFNKWLLNNFPNLNSKLVFTSRKVDLQLNKTSKDTQVASKKLTFWKSISLEWYKKQQFVKKPISNLINYKI